MIIVEKSDPHHPQATALLRQSHALMQEGAADALMRQLEDEARELKLPMLKLETGNVLHAAHKLYARHGFTECGVFGDYVTANSSIFMEKSL